jgi:tetratricopeptide (TPR) repeat protein
LTEALQLEIRTLKELLDSERDPAGRAFAPLADAYRKAGRIPEALRILRDGISKHPDFVTGHVVAAQLYVEQGLAAEGAIAARRALELDGENVSALRSLLRALDETGAVQEAEGIRSLLTALEPDFEPDWTSPAPGEEAEQLAEAALAPTVALSALHLEPTIDEQEALELEVEAPSTTIDDGMIDLSTIGPIPSADVPASALAPDLPLLDMPSPVASGVDFGLVDLTPSAGEALSVGADEPVMRSWTSRCLRLPPTTWPRTSR